MAKRSQATDAPVGAGTSPEDADNVRKRVKRLERELGELEATETRRLAQLEKVRAEMTEVRTRLADLGSPGATTGPTADPGAPNAGTSAPTPGPTGYCMREKRRVQISDPTPVTLSNGRAATAGTCATCGARVVALTKRAAPKDA